VNLIAPAELTDPQFASDAEREAALQRYSRVRDCLNSGSAGQSADGRFETRRLLDAFLYFTGPPRDRFERDKIRFDSSADRAIVTLRDTIGVPASAGAAYIVYFPTRDSVPSELRYAFSRSEAIAATLPCRYILILGKKPVAEEPVGDFAGGRTVSHELVHSYICAAAGSKPHAVFPGWFREGLASYLSGSSRISGELDRSGSYVEYKIHQETPEYLRYSALFQYIEGHFGSASFAEFVKGSLQSADPESELGRFGFANAEAAFTAARKWANLQPFSGIADSLRNTAVHLTARGLLAAVAVTAAFGFAMRKRIRALVRSVRERMCNLLLYEESAAFLGGWLRAILALVLLYFYVYLLQQRGVDGDALVYLLLGFLAYHIVVITARALYRQWHLWPHWPVPLEYRKKAWEYLERVYQQCARAQDILNSQGEIPGDRWRWVFPEACEQCGWRERALAWPEEDDLLMRMEPAMRRVRCTRCGDTTVGRYAPLGEPDRTEVLAPPRFPMLFSGPREPDGPQGAPFELEVRPDPEWLHPMLWETVYRARKNAGTRE
jgi:hypothetical protein